MTSLAAAVAIDSRGPSGIYIITDSRITWTSARENWDAGRKTFASPTSPDIYGYCGDAYFVPIILGQVFSLFEGGLFAVAEMGAQERHALILDILKNSVTKVQSPHIKDFSVFHGARDGELMSSRFRLWRSHYAVQTRSWVEEELTVSQKASYLAHVDGSGKAVIERHASKWVDQAAAGTSRAAMHSFCKSLHSGADPFSGGPPQLVGVWRKGHAQQFGFCWDGKSYVSGVHLPSTANHKAARWFNHVFEECDGGTGKKLPNSKSHGDLAHPANR